MTKSVVTKTTYAELGDGSIQFTFSIPWKEIQKKRDKKALEIGEGLTLPGFRKGKAPLAKLLAHIAKEDLVEKTLNDMLPKLFTDAVNEHEARPAILPRFELVSVEAGSDWQVRATTCNLPDVTLGDYKKHLNGLFIGKKNEPSKEEKEQLAMDSVLKNVQVDIPQLLVSEEVNSRLARLLEKIEKLGLNIDNYLASLKKTPDELRKEYKEAAEKAIKLDLILNKIYDEEKLEIKDSEFEEYVKAAESDPNFIADSDEQKRAILSVLRRRKALDKLVASMG